MDKIIAEYECVPFDDDHMICPKEEIVYQLCVPEKIVPYDKAYWDKYIGYEDTTISKGINEFRTSWSSKRSRKSVLDIGIGSGEFIKKSKVKTYGYDVNPYAIEWLEKNNLYLDPYKHFPDYIDCVTLWDTLEHIPDPSNLLKRISVGCHVLLSIPIFTNIWNIKESKHFRLNEHVYYFTKNGLLTFMNDNGYKLVEESKAETEAGRDSIGSFAFEKISR